MKRLTKQVFQNHLQHQYWLRFHMLAILLATTLSGVVFSKVLLLSDVTDFRIRYALSVVLSYLIFFVCIKLWLRCITSNNLNATNDLGLIELPMSTGQGSGVGKVSLLQGGGGQFSGGGAASSLEDNEAVTVGASQLATPLTASESGSSVGLSHLAGEAACSLGDDNIIVAVISLAVLIATILVSTVYILYGAPTILSEAAFQGVLTASLIKRTRTIGNHSWIGSIFKATWAPFALTLAVALLCGFVLHTYFPEAVKLTDIVRKGR